MTIAIISQNPPMLTCEPENDVRKLPEGKRNKYLNYTCFVIKNFIIFRTPCKHCPAAAHRNIIFPSGFTKQIYLIFTFAKFN